VQDETGDIRVALWGDKADAEIAPGDEVALADVEIQDGWQDDLEASAGWRSSVTVLDDGNVTDAPGPDAGRSDGRSQSESPSESSSKSDGATGLDSFADGTSAEASDRRTQESDGVVEAGADADSDSDTESGETVAFTGTVVQAGKPVVLDDGEETISVETDADVHLGQQVTVRGVLREGRLDADDVETV
jgi:replication factor A1